MINLQHGNKQHMFSRKSIRRSANSKHHSKELKVHNNKPKAVTEHQSVNITLWEMVTAQIHKVKTVLQYLGSRAISKILKILQHQLESKHSATDME